MRRRDFIKVIAGSAAVWPFSAHAQREQMKSIGILLPVPRMIPISGPPRSILSGVGVIGLERWPKCAHRAALGHGQCRRAS